MMRLLYIDNPIIHPYTSMHTKHCCSVLLFSVLFSANKVIYPSKSADVRFNALDQIKTWQ